MTAQILVVDDEPDLELLIQQKFRHQIREGAVAFLFARDGVDALAQLQSNADIDMVQGLTVRGKVTDKATGKPVARARVEYEPVFPNHYVNAKLSGRWSPQS